MNSMTKSTEKRTIEEVYDNVDDTDNNEPECKKPKYETNHVVMADDAWVNILQFLDFVSAVKCSMVCKHFKALFRNHGEIRAYEIRNLSEESSAPDFCHTLVGLMTNNRWIEMITNCCFSELLVFEFYGTRSRLVKHGISILKFCIRSLPQLTSTDILRHVVCKFRHSRYFGEELKSTIVESGNIEALEFFVRNTQNDAIREEISNVSRCKLFVLAGNFDEYQKTIRAALMTMLSAETSTFFFAKQFFGKRIFINS